MNRKLEQKIGILGGTFDPVHNAHLQMAEQAYREYGLDKVLLMPSRVPPHKQDSYVTAPQDRLQMVELAVRDKPFLECSDFELTRNSEGQSFTYTADTLTRLSNLYPEIIWYFIVGADSLLYMDQWNSPKTIFAQAVILVSVRNGLSITELEPAAQKLREMYQAQICFLHMTDLPISSTDIRTKIACGTSVAGLLPESVEAYITKRGLYKSGSAQKAERNEVSECTKI